MRGFFRLFVFVLLVSGWSLAASALHLVRTPGEPHWLGKVMFIPKDRLTFKETYVDMRRWSPADVATHPLVVNRLAELNMNDLVSKALSFNSNANVSTPVIETVSTPSAPSAPRDSSIFGGGQ